MTEDKNNRINNQEVKDALVTLRNYGVQQGSKAANFVANKLRDFKQRTESKVDQTVNGADDVFDTSFELSDLMHKVGVIETQILLKNYRCYAGTDMIKFADNITGQIVRLTNTMGSQGTYLMLIYDNNVPESLPEFVVLTFNLAHELMALLKDPEFKQSDLDVDLSHVSNMELYEATNTLDILVKGVD